MILTYRHENTSKGVGTKRDQFRERSPFPESLSVRGESVTHDILHIVQEAVTFQRLRPPASGQAALEQGSAGTQLNAFVGALNDSVGFRTVWGG